MADDPMEVDTAAIENFLAIRHKHEAIVALRMGDLHLLNPEIGNERSAQFALVVMRAHRQLIDPRVAEQRPLLATKEADRIIAAWRRAHADDKAYDQIRTPEDAAGASHDPEFDDFIRQAESVLRQTESAPSTDMDERLKLFLLARRFTVTKRVGYTIVGLAFSSEPGPPLWRNAPDDIPDAARREHGLRVEFNRICDGQSQSMLSEAAGLRAAAPHPEDMSPVLSQLLSAYPKTVAELPGPHPDDAPIGVHAAYTQVRANSYINRHERNALLFRVSRIVKVTTSWNVKFVPVQLPAFLFIFNKDRGCWTGIIADLLHQDIVGHRAVIVHDCFSHPEFNQSEHGKEFSVKSDRVDFMKMMLAADPEWLCAVQAAGSQAYPAGARNGKDCGTVYADICRDAVTEGALPKPSATQCGGFNADPGDRSMSAPSLSQEFEMAAGMAKEQGLPDQSTYFEQVDDAGVMKLRAVNSFRIFRTYAAKVSHAMSELAEWDRWFAIANEHGIRLGGYAVRVGNACYSIEEYEHAAEIAAIEDDKGKVSAYFRLYPTLAYYFRTNLF